MPAITDTAIDLSSLAKIYDTVAPNGLQQLLFLGKTLSQSLLNLSPGGGVSAVASCAPVVNGSSGVGVNNPNYIDTQLFQQAGSETLYIVCALSSFGTSLGYPLTCINTAVSEGVTLLGGINPYLGIQAEVSLNVGGTNTVEQLQVYSDNSAASQAMYTIPQMYVLRIDMAGMVIYFKNLSQPSLAAKTVAIPSGATRETSANFTYRMGEGHGSGATQTSNIHFFAQYNRATTPTEDAAIYAQVKASLAIRGVTI